MAAEHSGPRTSERASDVRALRRAVPKRASKAIPGARDRCTKRYMFARTHISRQFRIHRRKR
eukprot:15434147-Alexandrium_andersonii.AAC.1